MSKTIFAICSGAYSDWAVHLLCETCEQAEQAIAAMGGEYDIEEFDYYPQGTGPGTSTIFEARGLEGTMDISVESWTQFGPAPARPDVEQGPWRGNRQEHPIYIAAKCRDRDAAVKSVKDRLAALKALGPWPEPEPRDLDQLHLALVR